LAAVSGFARKLQHLLASLDDWESDELYSAINLPRMGGVARPLLPDKLHEQLEILAIAADRVVCSLPASARGQRDLYRRRFQSAKWYLTVQCADLLEACGDEATGSTAPATGSTRPSLFRLVCAVYEYATGNEADVKGAGLESYVRKIGGIFRRRRAITQEMFRRSGGQPIRPFSPGSELWGELAELGRQLEDALLPPIELDEWEK
jgi:hypothetical protein